MNERLYLKLIEDSKKRHAEIDSFTPASINKSKHCQSFKQYLKDADGYLYKRFYKEMLLHLEKEQIIISDWGIYKGGSIIEVKNYSGNVICRRAIKEILIPCAKGSLGNGYGRGLRNLNHLELGSINPR